MDFNIGFILIVGMITVIGVFFASLSLYQDMHVKKLKTHSVR
jgi:hypothetical protein